MLHAVAHRLLGWIDHRLFILNWKAQTIMDKFKNDTYVLLAEIAEVNEHIVDHTEHPQDVCQAIAKLIKDFAESH